MEESHRQKTSEGHASADDDDKVPSYSRARGFSKGMAKGKTTYSSDDDIEPKGKGGRCQLKKVEVKEEVEISDDEDQHAAAATSPLTVSPRSSPRTIPYVDQEGVDEGATPRCEESAAVDDLILAAEAAAKDQNQSASVTETGATMRVAHDLASVQWGVPGTLAETTGDTCTVPDESIIASPAGVPVQAMNTQQLGNETIDLEDGDEPVADQALLKGLVEDIDPSKNDQ